MQFEFVPHTPGSKVDVLPCAGAQDVLGSLGNEGARGRHPAQPRGLFDDHHPQARLGEITTGDQAVVTTADDDHVVALRILASHLASHVASHIVSVGLS